MSGRLGQVLLYREVLTFAGSKGRQVHDVACTMDVRMIYQILARSTSITQSVGI